MSRPRFRSPVVVASLVLLAAARLSSLDGRLAVLAVALAAVAVAGGVAGGRALARRRLAHLPAGALWAGAALISVGDLRAADRLRASAPRGGIGTALLLPDDLAPGLLVLEATRVRWEPRALARWAGASPWEVARRDVVAVEVGVPGRLRGLGRPWLRVWLSDRSSLAAHVVTLDGLQPVLDRLGLGSRRIAPS